MLCVLISVDVLALESSGGLISPEKSLPAVVATVEADDSGPLAKVCCGGEDGRGVVSQTR